MNLAYKYPIVYWNTANLIVDSGGIQLDDEEEEIVELENDEEEYEDTEEVTENKKKKKVKNTDYGKVATAIGNFQKRGIKIMPPDINNSSFTFVPNAKDNTIIYGLRGIARVSGDLINQIIANRPYSSLQDFLKKNNTNKLQTLNLIKSGAFDATEGIAREDIMRNYISLIADKKERLTLQNMQMLITKELISDEMSFYAKLFLFNKYLKTCKQGAYYGLNNAAINFISSNFDVDIIEDGCKVNQKLWDNLYKKGMEPMRVYLKNHKEEMLNKLNQSLYDEVADKYAKGNISKWEMDSISFYYHDHELIKAANAFDSFFDLPEEPIVEYSFNGRDGQEIKIYQLYHIIGTVIDKDKNKNTVTLLTPTGVVNVKIYKNQFALYDKQISEKGEDGIKHVIEPSWFQRGTKLMVQGIRRGMDFIPKKKKNSVYPIISKITNISEYGDLTYQYERMESV